MNYLGIDAGASATKWSLINGDGPVLSGVQDAMDGHLYRESSQIRMQRVLKEIHQKIDKLEVVFTYMGITGVTLDGSIEREIASIFHSKSKVISDIELAYRANFSEGEGILLYAGTGSVAFAINERNEAYQIGGWGYLLGDEGAGYWIGREAIRHTLLQIESKGDSKKSSLADAVSKELNAYDWNGMKTYVYSQERSAIAALSLVVDMCADAGDDSAIKILNNAASHLIGLITRMENSLSRDSLPIKFTGGISGSKLLYYELEKFFKIRISISEVDIAARAAELSKESSFQG
ncbi:hypothetical protein LBMAG10_12880 [Actinomycetes bacterium]|nr:hypothetical protein LBMAG10_12880 [Actinomycetes bacterium]